MWGRRVVSHLKVLLGSTECHISRKTATLGGLEGRAFAVSYRHTCCHFYGKRLIQADMWSSGVERPATFSPGLRREGWDGFRMTETSQSLEVLRKEGKGKRKQGRKKTKTSCL